MKMNHEKESKVYRVVAFSFGLLCILQVTLNICLRMFNYEFCGESGHQSSALLATNHNLTSLVDNLTSLVDNLTTLNLQLTINLERQRKQSLNAYCLPNNNKACQPCPKGWLYDSSRCYVIVDAEHDARSWQEARDDCRERNTDLTVIDSPAEQSFIYEHSWGSSDESNGYWIGLTYESGSWHWIDGRDLEENKHWKTPQGDGLCATSVGTKSTFAVNCTAQKRWICEMKALNV